MPDEINNKKLQYLKRDEVRTMEKDIARLRERESEATREKIAQIKTGEETGLEAARIEQSKRAAQERVRRESEAKRKEEELGKIRERKAADLSAEAASEEAKAEEEKEQLRTQLKEAQSKEEEARRKFLENIARQSGEVRPEGATEDKEAEVKPYEPPAPPPIRPIPPVPLLPADLSADVSAEAPAGAKAEAPEAKVEAPLSGAKAGLPAEAPAGAKAGAPPKKPFKFPKLPSFRLPKIKLPGVQLPKVQLPKVQLPKVEGYFPQKPSVFAKIWIRIIVSLFVLAVLVTLITFWYWYLAVRPQMSAPVLPASQAPQEEKLKITQMLLQSGYHIPASARVISSIVIHSGYNKENPYDLESAIQSYSVSGTAVHYLISREGAVFQLTPDYAVAYHAGSANNISIGIGLIYQESESPNEAQYQSLGRLIKNLQEKYNIPLENVRGYKDISPAKTTPWNFDQEYLEPLLK